MKGWRNCRLAMGARNESVPESQVFAGRLRLEASVGGFRWEVFGGSPLL
jgi:hypothetical protein